MTPPRKKMRRAVHKAARAAPTIASTFSFATCPANIGGNRALREPQKLGYVAIHSHFAKTNEMAFIQLPVGCGKTGLMGLAPFGFPHGRALIVAPNLTIRDTVFRELDISSPESFYLKRGVLEPPINGPQIAELKSSANIHDCDNSDIVVANIQQFAGGTNKWYVRLPRDYFNMILIDEGHHAPAATWQRLFDHFSGSKVIMFTGTPFRADGKPMEGKCIYSYGYTSAMINGFISPILSLHVTPQNLTFTVKGKKRDLSLDDVRTMSEHDWFSKGVALSEVCNKDIVDASIRQLTEVRKYGGLRQIIASACSIRHAVMIAALYRERGLKADVLSSNLDDAERKRIEAELRSGMLDVIVQVQMLGEGFDLGTLSVGALFRPYRNLAPYVQFVGRILRLAEPLTPHSASNRVYLVSHVGMNDERWWNEFTQFDSRDQQFFKELGAGVSMEGEERGGPRLTLRPFMNVVNETISEYAMKGFLRVIDSALLDQFKKAVADHGFDLAELGLTDDVIRGRLAMADARNVPAIQLPVSYQRRREQLRVRLRQDERSAADAVINRCGFRHAGRDLVLKFPGKGDSNVVVVMALVSGWMNKQMDLDSGTRNEASVEQLEKGISLVADVVDVVTMAVKGKL